MSNKPDIEEVVMVFEEKSTWVGLAVALAVPVTYFAVVLGELAHTPAAQIAYERPLLSAIIAGIVLTIVFTILMGIGTGITTAIRRGAASVVGLDRKDERDVEIFRRGELVGYYVTSAGMVVALIVTMMRLDYFWIANGIYASFVLGSIVSSAVKLVAYRRGF
jgi:hypothetical protein